jgi:two-component system nitrate/nitrite response regulator NarL
MNVAEHSSPIALVNTTSWADHRQYATTCEPQPCPRTLVVSDIRLFRDAMQQSLSNNREIDVVGVSSIEAVADQVRHLDPDVVVLDATGSGTTALIRSLKALTPNLSIVVITSVRQDTEFLTWVEAGVSGYADQNSSVDDLAAAVQHAARGEVLCSPRLVFLLAGRVAKLSARDQKGTKLNAMTPRERDVMALIAEGLSNKHIAQRLGISDTTAKNHVHNILDKLGLQSRGQAAAQYHRLNGVSA